MLFLHHADVMDKLQGERQQFVVGVGSKQTVVHDLWRKRNKGNWFYNSLERCCIAASEKLNSMKPITRLKKCFLKEGDS